ncbi:RTC4-like domain-containing protein [Cerioporus squamosus]|nr:RTC4-like domain-containing protein [Cerioporus squamosus]
MDVTPKPSRPAPRPVKKAARSSLGKSQTEPDLGGHSSQEKSQPLSRSQTAQEIIRVSSDESDDERTDAPKTAKGKGKGKGKTYDPFGTLSPLSTHVKRHDSEGQARSIGKGKERADPIGTLSPLSSPARKKRKDTLSSFPIPSPLSSPGSRHSSSPPRGKPKQSSSRRRGVIVSSSDDDEAPRRALRPFPMETQVLASIRPSSPVGKRASLDSDGEDLSGTYRKKQRRDSERLCFGDGSDSDDDMFLDPSIDPKTLCPWCDERLPDEPTPHLRALISAAKRVSHPEDRLTNPLGLRAPPAAFVGVCQRHRFERDWIPRARQKRWPTRIAWDKLAERIIRLQATLQAIVDDVDEDFAPGVARGSTSRRPRKENEFWQEVAKNVRQQGSRQAAGVRGQFQHFNKTQPGYYGELGYVIIHQTLCDLFPPAEFHPDATLPLTPADFITLVLVPEAAVHLIMEDLSLPRDKAIQTLRESVEYGVAMFPADDEGDLAGGSSKSGKLGATEKMFMDRARARRKELEEEERMEEEEARLAKVQEIPKPKPRPRAKKKTSGIATDVESAGPTSSPPSGGSAKRKTRGSSVSRGRPAGRGPGPGSFVIELSSDTGESEAAGPSKRRRKTKDTRSDAETEAALTDEPTPKAVRTKPRPRPKRRSASASSSRQGGDDARSDTLDTDAEAPSPLPSAVAFDRVAGPGATEATPRAKANVCESDTLSINPSPSEASTSKPKTPLEIAREKRQQGSKRTTSINQRKATDDWQPNLRSGNVVSLDSTDDESDVQEVPASSRAGTSNAGACSKPKHRDPFGWLLNDSSQSRPSSPS